MNLMVQRFTYVLGDELFYETLDRYKPDKTQYVNVADTLLPAGWRSASKGLWHQCLPPAGNIPAQGWKIHLSATSYNARDVLAAAIPVLIRAEVAFKFAVDRRIFQLMSSKNWERGGSGKFITVYPRDDAQFHDLIERLHAATSNLSGPYILTDLRYKEHGIVYYRYGTMRPQPTVDMAGHLITSLIGPNGERITDDRSPFFRMPPWVKDPFVHERKNEGEAHTLKDGRYEITGVIQFSNAGGVYLGVDRTNGIRVIIKEARPFVGGTSAENDAVALRQKEFAVMKAVEGLGVAPAAYDLFQDWEHWFLVQEHIPGITLQKLTARESILLNPNPTQADFKRYHCIYRDIFRSLALAVAAFHERGIALCDLSPNNVMVLPGEASVRLIDFEGACRRGVDLPVDLVTPGFAPHRAPGTPLAPAFEDDYYALAAMMVAFVTPITQHLRLRPDDWDSVVRDILANAAMPVDVADAVVAGLARDPMARPEPRRIASVLDVAAWPLVEPARMRELERRIEPEDLANRARELSSFITDHATPARTDRLFPPDFRAFQSNPYGLGYGAFGTLLALHRYGVRIEREHLDWAVEGARRDALVPPGLLSGRAGFAWALLELGETNAAADMLELSRQSVLLEHSAGLFEGRAGWALASLRLYLACGESRWLDAALNEVEAILAAAETDDAGRLSWRHPDGRTHLGLGFGASGVALVLLYAGLLSGHQHYVESGLRALRFDAANAIGTGGRNGRSFAYVAGDTTIKLPYFMYGSAGVGAVLLRYKHLSGIVDDEFDTLLEELYVDTDRTTSLGVGKLMGLTGLAGFRLDAYRFTGEQQHLDVAMRILDAIHRLRCAVGGGATYPTEGLDRLACDYGNGSAGVLAMIARLLQGTGDELTLDDIPQVARPHILVAS